MVGITDSFLDQSGVVFRSGFQRQQVAIVTVADGAGNAADVGGNARHAEGVEYAPNGATGHEPGENRASASREAAERSLRQYIYEKYLFSQSVDLAGSRTNGA